MKRSIAMCAVAGALLSACGSADPQVPAPAASPATAATAAAAEPTAQTAAERADPAATSAAPIHPAATPLPTIPAASTSAPSAPPNTEVTPMRQPSTPANDAPSASAGAPLSEAQIVALIRSDLAKQLNIADSQIQLVASNSRVWPDKGLGCAAQKGLYEPEQVPGYAITLGYGGASYQYHTNLSGRYVRCDAAGKPLGPIR